MLAVQAASRARLCRPGATGIFCPERLGRPTSPLTHPMQDAPSLGTIDLADFDDPSTFAS
jgi:hypothetical protein